MGRLVTGSVVAAIVMFVLGFIFYATPLMQIGQATAPVDTQLAVHEALKSLPGTGTYFIPFDETDPAIRAAHESGPTAVVKVNMTGSPQMDPMVFAAGYVHMALTAFLIGLLLWTLRHRVNNFVDRAGLVILLALVAAFFTRLGEPVWYRTDWANALYVGFADFVMLAAAGLVIARWFMPRSTS